MSMRLSSVCFSILLRIDLVFGEVRKSALSRARMRFQYPLADRLGFWGFLLSGLSGSLRSFSILLRIDLVFGGRGRGSSAMACMSFSILLEGWTGF